MLKLTIGSERNVRHLVKLYYAEIIYALLKFSYQIFSFY